MNKTPEQSAKAYGEMVAVSASAVGQVVALYDRILRDLHDGLAAIETGSVERRVQPLNHALTIIGELQGVLDFEQGGQPAKHLNSFYNVTRGMILEAGVNSSQEKLRELVGMFARLRAAWAQVERLAPRIEVSERVRITGAAVETVEQGARQSGWSA